MIPPRRILGQLLGIRIGKSQVGGQQDPGLMTHIPKEINALLEKWDLLRLL